jgi:hypothetical protein
MYVKITRIIQRECRENIRCILLKDNSLAYLMKYLEKDIEL